MTRRRFATARLGQSYIVMGIAALALSPLTDHLDLNGRWGSFAHGFLIGVGLALTLGGVYLVSAHSRRVRNDWLPSRDGEDEP